MKKNDGKIVRLAQKRWQRCQEWEAIAWQNFQEDLKFHNADARNGWQWPVDIQNSRKIKFKSCLTLNETRQHNLLIINEQKQNKPGIKYRAVGGDASVESANIRTALARHVQYNSNADAAFDKVSYFQIVGGIGYFRVKTGYENDGTLDQEIFLEAINNPMSVYMDPDAKEFDKSDARFGFIWDMIEKDDVPDQYSEYEDKLKDAQSGQDWHFGTPSIWYKGDKVAVCEYFYVEMTSSKKFLGADGKLYSLEEQSKEMQAKLLTDDEVKFRNVPKRQVKWCLIIGNKLVDEKDWPGSTIPIVPAIGEEVVIDGQLDRKGHTRAMIDCQRMYNYWSSSAVDYGALQTNTQWIADAKSIEGYEKYWETMNSEDYPFLPYNSLDDTGKPFTPPQRINPPNASPVALQGMQVAKQELMMVSGQFGNSTGDAGNERTGRAINSRQRQGETSYAHYPNNMNIAVRRLGIIIDELLPVVYDTERVKKILAEDGEMLEVTLDPQAPTAYSEESDEQGKIISRILNPMLGKYEVEADAGPGYATKREETFNALTILLTQSPTLVPLIGDLLLRAADFPLSQEAAQRLRRMVPQQALGDGPTQNEQSLMQQLEQMKALLGKTMQELAVQSAKTKSIAVKREISLFDALTKRIDVLQKGMEKQSIIDPSMVAQNIADVAQTDIAVVEDEIVEDLNPAGQQAVLENGGMIYGENGMVNSQGAPPVPGARRAPDGNWYVENPNKPGSYLHVGGR